MDEGCVRWIEAKAEVLESHCLTQLILHAGG